MKHTLPQQIKFGPPISLSLDQLEASNLAFGLPLGPGKLQACANSGFISPKSSRKAPQLRGLALQGVCHPQRELGGRVISDEAEKRLGEVVDLAEFTVRLLQELEVFLLFLGEPLRRQTEPPGDLSRGRESCFQRRWPRSHDRASC